MPNSSVLALRARRHWFGGRELGIPADDTLMPGNDLLPTDVRAMMAESDQPLRTAHLLLARALFAGILSEHFPPGSALPKEHEIAVLAGVSRPVVREALRTLASKGLVKARRRVGTSVAGPGRPNLLDPQLLEWAFALPVPAWFAGDLLELRLIVEPPAAACAAVRRTGRDLSLLGASIELLADPKAAVSAVGDATADFHRILFVSSGNEALGALGQSIAAGLRWMFAGERHPRRPDAGRVDRYRRLFGAVADRNGKLASALCMELIPVLDSKKVQDYVDRTSDCDRSFS